jgi:hypothetical protein
MIINYDFFVSYNNFHHENTPVKQEKRFNWAGEKNKGTKLILFYFRVFVLSCFRD